MSSNQNLSISHLLSIKDVTLQDIHLIFETAKHFKEILSRPIKKVPSLSDISIVNLFFENSTRTRISFELAEKRLSADVVNFSVSSSSVNKGETLLDTVKNILAMKIDMVVIRHFAVGVAHFLAQQTRAVIINAGDGVHEHPTQALLDAFSILLHLKKIKGVKVAIIGDLLHSRVGLSNIFALQKLGAQVMVCAPPTLLPKSIKLLGVQIETSLQKALCWCDVANILRIQLERQREMSFFPSMEEYMTYFGVNEEIYKQINKKILFLHPGPINRGLEMTSQIADSSDAIILDQVENGVAIRMAVLYLLARLNGFHS